MTAVYPHLELYAQGMVDVGDGNFIHWETCGNPAGKPAVVFIVAPARDARRHRVSPPPSGDREWLIFGIYWGSTLALAYAESHPSRVTEIILAGVTTTGRSEIDWLYRGVAPLFPEQWEQFCDGVPETDRGDDLIDAYYRLLQNPDLEVCLRAARSWCAWEAALVSVDPKHEPEPRRLQRTFQLAFARIVTHYFHHAAWLEDGVLLREADALAEIPGIMVHGRLDLAAPLVTAWEPSRVWKQAELVLVASAGHSSADPGMTEVRCNRLLWHILAWKVA